MRPFHNVGVRGERAAVARAPPTNGRDQPATAIIPDNGSMQRAGKNWRPSWIVAAVAVIVAAYALWRLSTVERDFRALADEFGELTDHHRRVIERLDEQRAR